MTTPTIYPLDHDISKTWFVKYPNPKGGSPLKKYGKLAQCNTLEEKLREADRIIREEIAWLSPSKSERTKDQLVRDIQNFYEYKCIGNKPKSVITYGTHVDEFISWYRTKWRGTDENEMGLHFIRHLADKGLGNTTLNAYRATMKSIFNKMIVAEKYTRNPFVFTKKLTERRQTKEWFRDEQLEEVMEKIKPNAQLWLACRMQFFLFIRPNSEMPQLRISDIQIADRRVKIRAEVGKKATCDEYIPIPDDMLAELDRLTVYPPHYFVFSHNGRPGLRKMGRDTMSKRHKAIMMELNYPKQYTYYSWKNTGAVHMLKAGINVVQISKLMRHKSLDYTREYFKSMGFDDMQEDLNKKYPKL